MSDLGAALEAMVTADDRFQHVSVSVISRYDPRYLSELVDTAADTSVAPLTAAPTGLGRLLPWLRSGGPPPMDDTDSHIVRARLRASKPDHWRYEQLGSDDREVLTSSGCDGRHRWAQSRGRLRTWRPQTPASVHDPPETSWHEAPHPPLREILDPALTLPSLTIKHSERIDSSYGPALRLQGTPRSADVIESALVSPWAETCSLDVHVGSGVVLASNNVREGNWVLVTHQVVELDLNAHHDPAVFAPPPDAG